MRDGRKETKFRVGERPVKFQLLQHVAQGDLRSLSVAVMVDLFVIQFIRRDGRFGLCRITDTND